MIPRAREMVKQIKMLATKPKVSYPGFTRWGGYFMEGLNGFLLSSNLHTCSMAHTHKYINVIKIISTTLLLASPK